MASKKKQKAMVLHQGRASNHAGGRATDQTPSCPIDLKPESEGEGRMNKGKGSTKQEAVMTGHQKSKVFKAPGRPTALKHPIVSDNVSPECVCKGIKVTLDNNNMWNEFFRCKTEMIVTKQGSRMFPYCRFRISGLQASKKYVLIMDIQPADNCCYKWTTKSWQVAGKAERHVKSLPFFHPESPSTGQHWMQNPVSFYKLKLTSNVSDQDGNVVLNLMHRYLPRLHVVETDKTSQDIKLNGPNVVTFTFPQTEFMAVTAYQNTQFAQLKVHYNPFAKGLKEDGSSFWGLKPNSSTSKDSKDADATTSCQHPVKKSLKSLLANHKPKTSKALDLKQSGSDDVQKKSQMNNQSSPKAMEESSSSNSQPAQKLISELIREAHVSLQRCNLEQIGGSPKSEQTNTRTTAVKGSSQDVSKMDIVSDEALKPSPEGESDTVSANSRKDAGPGGRIRTSVNKGSLVSQKIDSDDKPNPKALSEVSIKQHKRPAPLPLPALALFLKQHSAKSKKLKSKPETLEVLHDSKSETLSSALSSECPLSESIKNPPKQLKEYNDVGEKSEKQDLHSHSSEQVLNVPGQAIETALSCKYSVASPKLKEPRTDDDYSTSALESSGRQPEGLEDSPVLHKSDHSFSAPGTITRSSTLTTSSPVLTPAMDTVLPTLAVPHTQNVNESSTPPLVSKSDTLLPDTECSSFGFESLSPASSPEPLPSFPTSLDFDLDSTPCDSKVIPPEELQLSNSSATSVFKWRTVLPPPSYVGTSLTLPLVDEPLIPSQTPNHPDSQTLDPCMSTSPSHPVSSFQENEQSLPFPAELSPLALQLTLSPTFSSLDGDGLSPTPSIADLVHFFSTDDDLGMGVEFPNTEAVPLPCPPPATVEAASQDSPQQQVTAPKPSKHKKRARQRKLSKAGVDHKTDDPTYTTMQPNLEEVEEQLFISFTSKEALKLHVVDSSEGPATDMPLPTSPEVGLQRPTEDSAHVGSPVEAGESSEESIAAFEKLLLKDLRLMKHRQIIHPVLQEVGLKMNLLDTSLSIDLQYLGVRLPIPPPGASLEPPTQELPTPQGVCPAFMSRTGKTTDVTQIKGWREKFTPSTASSSKEDAVVSPEPNKKNLSAFCSDMLDEYLENEGKFIDERAASFSQASVEPPVYELPARSSSYVRTLDSVLKKNTGSSPTSDLISGFIPPSKRPKLPPRGPKAAKKERKQRVFKQNTPRVEPVTATDPSPATQNTTVSPPSEDPTGQPAATAEPPKSRKNILKDPATATLKPFMKRRRRKHKILSHYNQMHDMAPLESDSELGRTDETYTSSQPMMTRTLLKQKQLEDGVMWEGYSRNCITEERASIALTSLFTLMGFVSENPTAPIQLPHRRTSPCLNDFCQLGCICASLSYSARISHCGRAGCMFGCSCLKQKVVLLKNLDGSDSSPSRHGNNRRRKRRMKMAYVLKEADSVSHPAERVRSLWKKDGEDLDPEPIYVPKPVGGPHVIARTRTLESQDNSSCARIRAFQGKINPPKNKELSKKCRSKGTLVKSTKEKGVRGPKPKHSGPRKGSEPAPSDLLDLPSSPQPEPKPSRRLIIDADCQWQSDSDRSHVMKVLCKAMAQDQLKESFWIRKYLVQPVSQTVEESNDNCCVEYKVHISQPKRDQRGPAVKQKKSQQQKDTKAPLEPVEAWQQEVMEDDEEPPEYWQREVMEEEEVVPPPIEEWQREVIEEEEEEQEPLANKWQGKVMEDAEPVKEWKQEVMGEKPLEDWQREVEEDDFTQEEEDSSSNQVPDWSGYRLKMREERKKKVAMGLPFLKGISAAGFLSATKKQQDGNDHLVQVNGKLYPLAKIQLGEMGALHPANRLAAYLTGRVRNRKQQGSTSLSSQCPQNKTAVSSASPTVLPSLLTSTSTPHASTTLTPAQPPMMLLTLPSAPTGVPPAGLKAVQSAPLLKQSADVAPTGSRKQLIKVTLFQRGAAKSAAAPRTSAPASGPVAVKSSQVLMIQVPNPPVVAPMGQALRPPAPKTLTSRLPSTTARMVFQPLQSAPQAQYYRRSDGKLVQLIPIDQLRPVTSLPKNVKGPSSPLVTPALSLRAPVPGLSGLNTFTVPPPQSIATLPASGLTSPKKMCNFKIAPSSSDKERIIVTSSKVPYQIPAKLVAAAPGSFAVLQPQRLTTVKPTTPKPAASQSTGTGVNPTPVSGAPDLQNTKATSSSTTIVTTSATSSSTTIVTTSVPTEAKVESSTQAQAELAYNLGDLDIICVDKDNMSGSSETKDLRDVVEVVDSSSEETENSSDFGDDSDLNNERKGSIRNQTIHTMLERKRRKKMSQLMGDLKQEVGLDEKMSKVTTLTKAAQVIKELRTAEGRLVKRKNQLRKRRDKLLSVIAPTTGETLRGTANKLVDDWSDVQTEDSSDEESHTSFSGVEMLSNGQSVLDALKALVSANKDSDSNIEDFHLLEQAHQEINTLQLQEEQLKTWKVLLNKRRDSYVKYISRHSGKDRLTILRKLQHLSFKQSQLMKNKRPQSANPPPVATDPASEACAGVQTHRASAVVAPVSKADVAPVSKADVAPVLKADFAPVSKALPTPVQQLQTTNLTADHQSCQAATPLPRIPAAGHVSHNATAMRGRPRTIPNILSRHRNSQGTAKTWEASQQPTQALVPAEVASLVGNQWNPVLTVNPLMANPTVFQPPTSGVASVTLNLPTLSNSELHVTSTPTLSGENVNTLGCQYRIGGNTLSQIVKETCTALILVLREDYLKTPSTDAEWKAIASGFYTKCQFPHCLGAIDSKHIFIQPPAKNGNLFSNYKRLSIILMAVVDSNYQFIHTYVGAREFAQSNLRKAMDTGALNFPPVDILPGTDTVMPYVLVGNEDYPLRPDLMTPYSVGYLNAQQRIYNYRLSRAQQVVENAFGILANRFKVLRTTICLDPEKVVKIVFACLCLHNFLWRGRSDAYVPPGYVDTEDANHQLIEGAWRREGGLKSVEMGEVEEPTVEAKMQRDRLCSYFVTPAGTVSWQGSMV